MPDSAAQSTAPRAAPRGVYRQRFFGRNGERFLVVINRFGQRIFEATVYHHEDLEAAELALWEMLDREDPAPLLQAI